MNKKSPLDVCFEFIENINKQDVEKLSELMTDNHTFVDSRGTIEKTRKKMKEGWKGYFEMFPDFTIKIDNHFIHDNKIVLLGWAEGTFKVNEKLMKKNHWKIPAAWYAEIEDNKIRHWQVYADNIVVLEIMKAAQE